MFESCAMHSTRNISWFADISLADRAAVGGKGGSLGELTRANIAVPPGFVVTTRGFELVLAELEKENPIRSRVETLSLQDLTGIRLLSEEIRTRVAGVRAGLQSSFRREIRSPPRRPVSPSPAVFG